MRSGKSIEPGTLIWSPETSSNEFGALVADPRRLVKRIQVPSGWRFEPCSPTGGGGVSAISVTYSFPNENGREEGVCPEKNALMGRDTLL